jgi:hypothetical protein
MSGGEITDNTASSSSYSYSYSSGGGVYVASSGTFTMNNGEIMGNTAANHGGGVYVSGIFTMSGGARVNVNNPVCLYSSSFITIGGDLNDSAGPVAQIELYADNATPWSNWLGQPVIKLKSGYTGDLATLGSRFTLGNFIGRTGSSGSYTYPTWPITGYINADGNLAAVAP